jgi:large subunit ribosomal protein L23
MIINLVKYPVITEKSVRLIENNQYTFDVDIRLTKPQIKKLIEDLFQVKVIAVNTHRPPNKKKIIRGAKGSPSSFFKSRVKKAIITLKSSDSITLFDQNKIN